MGVKWMRGGACGDVTTYNVKQVGKAPLNRKWKSEESRWTSFQHLAHQWVFLLAVLVCIGLTDVEENERRLQVAM